MFGILLFRIGGISREMGIVRSELERGDSEWDIMKQGLYRLADDVLEAREVLRLPSQQYRFVEEGSEGSSTQQYIAPYLQGIDVLLENIRVEKTVHAIDAFSNNDDFNTFLTTHSLLLDSTEDQTLRIEWQSHRLFRISYQVSPPLYYLESLQYEPVAQENIATAVNTMQRQLPQLQVELRERERYRSEFFSLLENREIEALHDRHELVFANPINNIDGIVLPVEKKGEQILSLSFSFSDMKFHFLDQDFYSARSLATAYMDYVQTQVLSTSAEEAFQQVRLRLHEVLGDEGIISYLDDHGLYVTSDAREGEEHIFFDLFDAYHQRAGSLAIHRYTLEVWIMDKDDIPLTSLRSLSVSSRAHVPLEAGGDLTVLFAGLHEQLADTIMIAHMKKPTNTIYLFSMPRDLFYQGRKLNTLYRRYGARGFADEVAQIIGMHIDHYVYIDMYAFIELVDILGGIDVDLKEGLIDPSYKVKNQGRWSTLYYRAGIHHLAGREALRIARSRHTSDDFARSERQQLILQALFSKISDMNIIAVEKLYEFAKLSIKYVDTDLNPFQIMSYLADAKDIESFQRIVVDTSNILYSTYSNLYYSGRAMDEVDDSFEKGAWILLPLNNNWQLIPSFVQNFILQKPLPFLMPS